jgi:hypothetical protein
MLVLTLVVVALLAWLGWRPRRNPRPDRKPGAE